MIKQAYKNLIFTFTILLTAVFGFVLSSNSALAAWTINANNVIVSYVAIPNTSVSAINVSGNWTTSAAFTAGSNNTVTFNGTDVQTITGATTWNDLTINNTYGTPDNDHDVDPGAIQTVAGTLTVTDGQWSPFTGDDYADVSIGSVGIMKPDAGITVSGDWTNAGTFTHNSGTVTLDGTNQSLIGSVDPASTTFNNLTKQASADSILTITASSIWIINGTLDFDGTDDTDRLNLVSSIPTTGYTFDFPNGAQSATWLDVTDSSSVLTNDITCTNCGNISNNDDTTTPRWIFSDSGGTITISGNVYTDDVGTTAIGDTKVGVAINSTKDANSDTTSAGAFSFVTDGTVSSGDTLTLFLDTDVGIVGTMVTISDGNDLTGIEFYQNHVVVQYETGSDISILDMTKFDTNEDSDVNFTAEDAAPDTLTIEDGSEFFIPTGYNFDADGNLESGAVGIDDIEIKGTYTAGAAESIRVSGSWKNSGTFEESTSIVTFDATTSEQITSGGANGDFYDIIFNGSSGTWTLQDAMIVNNDLTSTDGTLAGTNDVTVNGNVACGGTCGAITLTGGTFLQSVGASAKNFGTSAAVATNWEFFNLTFTGNTGVVITTSSTGTGTIEATNALTISTDSTLNAGNRTYILSGAIAAPFVKTGTFQYSTGTMRFTGNSALVVVNALSGSGGSDGYYNLEIMPGGAVTYALASGTYQANNNLTIGDGAVAGIVSGTANDPTINVSGDLAIDASGTLVAPDAASNILSVEGSWSNSGTFTHSSQTVQFNGTASGKTINTGGTGTGKDFYNVVFNGTGGTWSALTNTMTIANDLTMTAGTLNNNDGSEDITVNGSVAGTAGIISLTTNTFEQRVSADKNFGTTSDATAWTFNNLTFSNSNGTATPVTVTTQTGGTGGITVTGNLLVGKAGDTAGATTTLNAGNRTWTLSDTDGDPFQILASPAGDLTPATSTFVYTGDNGAGNTTVQSETYNVLQINNVAETYALEGTTGGATVTITDGVLDTGANALNITGDLTATGTLQGTGNVTVNGNVTGAGTVNMTGGTFEQRVAANKNFGSSAGTNNWTFATLTFSNSNGAATPITITPDAGTDGQIIISAAINIGKDTDTAGATTTFDNETSNDRIFDINGNILISTLGIFSASSTASFTLAGNFTDNKTTSGGFTPNSSTVTIDGAGTSTFDGANTPAITFYDFTCATAGKTLNFTAAKTFKIDGKFTIAGASGSQININSTTASQWLIDHQGTEDVAYASITNSGCAGSTTNVSLNNTSTDVSNNDYTCWLFPSLSFTINLTSIDLDLNVGNNFTDVDDTMTLTVTARAEFGYSLTAYETVELTHTDTVTTIADWSGTNGTPTVWDGNCISDTQCGFGYNTNDGDLTQFIDSTYYAGFPTNTPPGDVVAMSTSDVADDETTITYRSSVDMSKKAGTYQTTIVYIATPEF